MAQRPAARFMRVKCPVIEALHDPAHQQRLLNYVQTVYDITKHLYALCRYIFIRSIEENPDFDVG